MMKNKYIDGIIVIIALFVIGVSGKLFKKYSNWKIAKHGKVTIAHIISVEPYNTPTPTKIFYYYVVNADTFFYDYTVESIINFRKLKTLEGKVLYVVYDSTNMRDNKLMIDEDKYK